MMYERLFFERAQIYEKEIDKIKPTECKWNLVKRLTNLPTEFTTGTQYPFYMSPDFELYLDIDQDDDVFVIRTMRTQKILYVIPEWIMSYREEKL